MPRISVKTISEMAHYVNTIKYVAKKDKCIKPLCGACNVYLPMKRSEIVPVIREQFDMSKDFYGKEEFRLGIHFEINFAPSELTYMDPWTILKVGYWISETEFNGCQTYFAVHDHSKWMHLDMIINPVNIYTGKMYGCGKGGWNAIGYRLCEYLKNFMPEECVNELQIVYPDKMEVVLNG